ncbi:hypothetical protein BC826DRAFT_624767 [Russula brevipes]|nr:hypothetical protein BC826DRAFT_624767 [Russula brevipes]
MLFIRTILVLSLSLVVLARPQTPPSDPCLIDPECRINNGALTTVTPARVPPKAKSEVAIENPHTEDGQQKCVWWWIPSPNIAGIV